MSSYRPCGKFVTFFGKEYRRAVLEPLLNISLLTTPGLIGRGRWCPDAVFTGWLLALCVWQPVQALARRQRATQKHRCNRDHQTARLSVPGICGGMRTTPRLTSQSIFAEEAPSLRDISYFTSAYVRRRIGLRSPRLASSRICWREESCLTPLSHVPAMRPTLLLRSLSIKRPCPRHTSVTLEPPQAHKRGFALERQVRWYVPGEPHKKTSANPPAGLDNQRRSGIQHRELSAPRQGLPIEISNSQRGAWMARRPPRKAEIKDAIATALRRQRGNAGAVETRGPGTEFRYGKVGVLAVVSNFQSLSNCHYAGVLVEPKNWSGVVGGSRPPAWMNTAQCLFRFRA